MRLLLMIAVLLIGCGSTALGQEDQSVLVNPPPQVQQVQPQPQPMFLIQRGLFGWRAIPVVPVVSVRVVVVRPAPRIYLRMPWVIVW